ncbi:DUF6285 domain-containing protein [Antrihabitans spumae]|uniref:DUF6285 domain-containing protein n=1 Tax=Antrihabitans spumae TaxID=3373370 RepID=A0ABW7K474_9NOCA
MQYRPDSAELLTTLADLLDDVLLPALPSSLQHRARVAANIVRILERERRLSPDADQQARARYGALLGHDGSVGELAAELGVVLRTNTDHDLERDAWHALVDVAKADLAIAKPGYDLWEGE